MPAPTRYLSARVLRNEDARLLTGRAQFVDDVQLPGMLHVAFVRSDYAHGRITSVDVSAARERAGVAAVYTAADLGAYDTPAPLLVPPPPFKDLVFNPCTHHALAKDKVRYVGEPLAMIVAASRYIAEDAVRDVVVEIDPIDAVVDLEAALRDGAPLVHEHLPSNAAAHVVQGKGDYGAARAGAHVVVKRRFLYDRGASAALENRAIVASWDTQAEELTIWDTTQAPIPIRNGLAARLGLSPSQVRVIAPFVGGGFGPKIMMFYPEELLLPWASMRLGCPIKWTEDRQENFYATTQERGQVHDAEMALARDGRILGVRDHFLFDTGAYDPYGLTIPINTQCTLLGPYDIPNYDSEFTAVFTNKPIVTPVRGAGRQHGVFVSERLLDLAARELGIDRVEIRKRNLIGPDRFPVNHEIMFQDSAPLIYDSGNYLPTLERAAEMIGFADFPREQARLRAEGKHVGIGVCCYVEGTGIGPYEGARVTVEPSGNVRVATGVGTQGQGHYTVFAQIVADVLGVDVTAVKVTTGDTREFQWGTGTFASRGAVVAGSACHAAATLVRGKILSLAATLLGAADDALELEGGRVFVRDTPGRSISLSELAGKANPLRGAVRPGTEPGLESTAYFGPDRGSTASGVHAMMVAVDPETAMVKIERYIVVHDCGTIINPLLVDGQIHGGVAHGIGNAFYEQLVYDEQGQLLNASFMDYLLPTATDVPPIETDHRETPSPFNPVGMKGVGEAGCIPTGAVFAQAVEDALSDFNIEIREIPMSPNKLFELISEAEVRLPPSRPEGASASRAEAFGAGGKVGPYWSPESGVRSPESGARSPKSGVCMNLNGTYTFAGPREKVWDLLQDPEVLAKALPGTERLVRSGDDRYEGVMKVSVGPVTAAKFDVVVVLGDKVVPERFTMQIDGKGSVGYTKGSASIHLSDHADGTQMDYTSNVQVGGKIAAVGQRLLESVGKMMMKQALEALQRELRTRLQGA